MLSTAVADHISDRLVEALNAARSDGAHPLELLTGLLFALFALDRTAPKRQQPPAYSALIAAAQLCVAELLTTDQARRGRDG